MTSISSSEAAESQSSHLNKIMKKFLILTVLSISMTACVNGGKTELGPEDTLKTFYSSLCAGDFDQAECHCDPVGMAEYLNGFRSTWEGADITSREIASDILSETEVEIDDVVKDGQKRTVTYTLTAADGTYKKKTAELRKEEGEWKIERIIDKD